jgi:hypothetical protein
LKHCSTRTGRIFDSKKSLPASAAGAGDAPRASKRSQNVCRIGRAEWGELTGKAGKVKDTLPAGRIKPEGGRGGCREGRSVAIART